MRRFLPQVALSAVVILLVACAPKSVKRDIEPNADLLGGQSARESALTLQPDWTLSGRLGVANGRDSGSGSLEWTSTESGDYRFTVHPPVTGKTWTLSGNHDHAVLTGLREQAVDNRDAAELLRRELGWRVPVAQLAHWVRAARASPEARIVFRADGLPGEIDEAGWRIEYPDYDTSHNPPLPTRVFASNGDARVRLAIREWNIE